MLFIVSYEYAAYKVSDLKPNICGAAFRFYEAHKFWSDKFLGIVRLKFNLDKLETPQEPVTLQLVPPQPLGSNTAVIASFVGKTEPGTRVVFKLSYCSLCEWQ